MSHKSPLKTFSRLRSCESSDSWAKNGNMSSAVDLFQMNELRDLNQFEFELNRADTSSEWSSIERLSFDWQKISDQNADAFVVRVKCFLNGGDPEALIPQVNSLVQSGKFAKDAIDVVGRFTEFSVSEDSPSRYCATLLVVYPLRDYYIDGEFRNSVSRIIDPVNDPYITLEMLDSFLARRSYANGDLESANALRLLEHNLKQLRPSSSLFLKLSATYPEECLSFLRSLCATSGTHVCDILGERSVHKLAVSYTSRKANESSQDAYSAAKQILEIASPSKSWGYVAFNTLMRMAQADDASQKTGNFKGLHPSNEKSRVHALNEIIMQSSLDPLDKMALRLMSNEGPIGFSDSRFERVWRIVTRPDDRINNEDFAFLYELLNSGSPAACHLTSVLLRHCVDVDNYRIGWRVASTVRSISKQVFGEVVHLCSKAYFKEVKMTHGNPGIWFSRVRWCVERQLEFLNRYPCGLALHIASHSRQFDTCWRWFTSMRSELAFRLTGYHTSAVLKAASYASDLDSQLDKIKETYLMTPSAEKSTFTFVPMTRVWEYTSEESHVSESQFWLEVAKDIRKFLTAYNQDRNRDRKISKVMHRIGQWEESFMSWFNTGSDAKTMSPLKTLASRSSAGSALRPNARSFQSYQSSPARTGSMRLHRQESAPVHRRSFHQSFNSVDLKERNFASPRLWCSKSNSSSLGSGGYPSSMKRHASGGNPPSLLRMQRFSSSGPRNNNLLSKPHNGSFAASSDLVADSNDPILAPQRDSPIGSRLIGDSIGQPRELIRQIGSDGSIDGNKRASFASDTDKLPVKGLQSRQGSNSLAMSNWAPSIWSSETQNNSSMDSRHSKIW